MRSEIVAFCRKACQKYGLQSYYLPKRNTYIIHLHGRAVQNFSEENFYEIPSAERMRMLLPLLKVGLHHNLGEKNHDNLFANSNGHRIWPMK